MSLSMLQALQTWFNIFIAIGIFITATAGLGNFYCGKKITDKKDQNTVEEKAKLDKKIESLLKGNDELKSELQPFKDIAKEKFPNENIQAALNRLSEDLYDINAKTEKTVFEIESSNTKTAPSGEFETNIQLKPRGENIIPIFSIAIKTQNNAIIKKFEVTGPTIPMMSYDRTSEDRTAISKEFRTMRPGEIRVTIITDKDPGRMSVGIEPLLSSKNK
jgi:hypothetical protein